jgi:IS30 family transposase
MNNNSEYTIIVFLEIFNRPVFISNTENFGDWIVSVCNGTRSKELVLTHSNKCQNLDFSYTFYKSN